ncbi:MAG: ISL3 family transposase, partial [Anaerolineae bacterium]|nr:ISL3 family transposase [Anaerolineae bacterium]
MAKIWLGSQPLTLEKVTEENNELQIEVRSLTASGNCPCCGQASHQLHSYTHRHPQDVSYAGYRVALHLRMKRFRCLNPCCQQQTFSEQLPGFLARYSRRTCRLNKQLLCLGLEVGGQMGVRLARLFQAVVSRQTLLRLVRSSPEPITPWVRYLGIDDWAYCKGKRYGTILVNLETHQVVDVLPDAEADTVATWLRQHPEVEIVGRDRASAYAEGSTAGAPQAQQVADRWHLLKNLWEVLRLTYTQHLSQVRQFHIVYPPQPMVLDEAIQATFPAVKPVKRLRRPPSPEEQARVQRRHHWEAVFAKVHELLNAGYSHRQVAQTLHIARNTVYKYAALTTLPQKTSPKWGPRRMDGYWDYLRDRLKQGHRPARQLHQELTAMGFQGCLSTVHNAMVQVRQTLGLPAPAFAPKSHPPNITPLTPGLLATWIFLPTRSETQQALIEQVCQLHERLELVTRLAQDFIWMLREKKPHHLLPWIEAAHLAAVPALKRFAEGLLRDFEAVYAACSLPWSNGQVEGHIHRLKLIKRQMYGRANFDLLRLRVLYHPITTTSFGQEP